MTELISWTWNILRAAWKKALSLFHLLTCASSIRLSALPAQRPNHHGLVGLGDQADHQCSLDRAKEGCGPEGTPWKSSCYEPLNWLCTSVSRMFATEVGQSMQQGLEEVPAVHHIGRHHQIRRMPTAFQLRCPSDPPHQRGSSCAPACCPDGGAVQGNVLLDNVLQYTFAMMPGARGHKVACQGRIV